MAQIIQTLSDELAQAVAAAGAAVVRVEARGRLPGSGIIWSADGLVVTAHHVVERDDNLTVGLSDGGTASATLVGRDPTTDLAVLRMSGAPVSAPTWASSDGLRVGHLVLALGRPGKSVMATLGIVSALGDSWRTPGGSRIERYLQTDVVMYPGFSGGPLVDVSGRVVGMNTSGLLRGVSVSVPFATVRTVVESLVAHGRVRRGYLGIGAQPVRLPSALAQRVGQETGLLVVSLESGGPAERQGIVIGDIFVALGGQPVRHMDDLLASLSADRIGSGVKAGLIRGGAFQEITLVIGERPESVRQ